MLKIKVGVYVRVSTVEQATDGYSIGEQEERLTKYVEAQNWRLHKIYKDPGFSGAKMDRPGLKDLIADVKDHKLDKVIVYKLDRLSRRQKDTLYLIEDVFIPNGVDFISMTESFDTGTPLGRAMIGVLSVFAQLERENIKERMCIGKEGRAKQGLFHGSKWIPLGYEYIDGMLEINEYEKMQINEIADLIIAGTPLRTIETLFNQKGYKHKYGSWDPKTMRRVLQNKTSLGYIRHKDEWYEGQHEAIISEEKFNAVNKILEDQRARFLSYGYRPGGNHTTILGGLLYCGRCGGKYAKQTGGKKKYNVLYYYACYSRTKRMKKMIVDPNCKNDYYKMEELDDMVLGEIRKLAIDDSYFDVLKENKNDDTEIDKFKLLDDQIKKIDDQISKLMDLYALGTISLDVIDAKVKTLSSDRNKLVEELKQIEKENKTTLSRSETIDIASTLDECLESEDIGQIRSVVMALIDKIVLDGQNVTIYWKFN